MQRTNDSKEDKRPRPSSASRKTSLKHELIRKREMAQNSAPSSARSTPKKSSFKGDSLDFMVTGTQIKKEIRANSLPGGYRRPSPDPWSHAKEEKCMGPYKNTAAMDDSKSTLDDCMSLDLSQISELEDANSKCFQKRILALATSSTPNPPNGQKRSESTQSPHTYRVADGKLIDSGRSSVLTSGTSDFRSTQSPESTKSTTSTGCSQSTELSTRSNVSDMAIVSPSSARSLLSGASNFTSWAESEDVTKVGEAKQEGEWSKFWSNYNNTLSRVGIQRYYDQCPTPYRTENIELAEFEILSESSRQKSPQNIDKINKIIRSDGLTLTARETQSLVKCAHILGNVLSKAIDRNSRQELSPIKRNPDLEEKKKNLTLELSPETLPLEVNPLNTENPTTEIETTNSTTQTDISLPFTKSAPRIFEKILRQLSRTSIDDGQKSETADTGESKGKEDGNKTI